MKVFVFPPYLLDVFIAISKKIRPDVIVIRGYFTVKNPWEYAGTPEPVMSPVVPLFPHYRKIRGHNSKKCGTGMELFKRLPTGIDKVVFSGVTTKKCRGGYAFGRSRYWMGDIPVSSPGGVRIKKNSPEQKIMKYTIRPTIILLTIS